MIGASMEGDEEASTLVHVSALDALVNVNSFLTGAVFIGLAFKATTNTSTHNGDSLVAHSACEAPADVARRMVVLEVLSFAFFMLSTLIAHGLKLQLALLSATWRVGPAGAPWPLVRVNERATRLGMVGTAVATVCGALCLTLSLVEVVQLRLGLLSCAAASSSWPKCAAFPLLACVLLGVSILTVTVLHAFFK